MRMYSINKLLNRNRSQRIFAISLSPHHSLAQTHNTHKHKALHQTIPETLSYLTRCLLTSSLRSTTSHESSSISPALSAVRSVLVSRITVCCYSIYQYNISWKWKGNRELRTHICRWIGFSLVGEDGVGVLWRSLTRFAGRRDFSCCQAVIIYLAGGGFLCMRGLDFFFFLW